MPNPTKNDRPDAESEAKFEESPTERSFIKSAFVGAIDSERILPYPRTPSQDAEIVETITDSFTRFAAEHIDAERFDREAHYPREVLDGLAELGLFRLVVPEEYGGLGLTVFHLAPSLVIVAITSQHHTIIN